jgi:hypothetical protein
MAFLAWGIAACALSFIVGMFAEALRARFRDD